MIRMFMNSRFINWCADKLRTFFAWDGLAPNEGGWILLAALGAAAVAGAIMKSAGGKKAIDPEWLKQHFGADAVNEETIAMFNNVINSPYGQQAMATATQQGNQFESQLRAASAASGLGAGEGGQSGSSIFSESAAGGATKGLQREAKAGIFQQVMPEAANMVRSRLAAYMSSANIAQQQPSFMQSLGGDITAGAEKYMGAMNYGTKGGGKTAAMTEADSGTGIPQTEGAPTASLVPAARFALPNAGGQSNMMEALNANNVRPARGNWRFAQLG